LREIRFHSHTPSPWEGADVTQPCRRPRRPRRDRHCRLVANRSSVVDAEVGSGQVVLLGLSVQHRAEAHGTYKLLFNSIYA
jgi:hypothetical protein